LYTPCVLDCALHFSNDITLIKKDLSSLGGGCLSY
jgi:hypothetical protein